MSCNHLPCKRCNISIEPKYIKGPFGPHEAKLVCPLCDALLKWVAKDKNNSKRPKNKHTPESLGIDFCQLCMRPRDRLGNYETLDSHHIIEIAKGGPDVPENIWVVCTPCHIWIHHQRTYLNDHISEVWKKYESLKEILNDMNLTTEVYEKAMANIADQLGV